MTTFRQSLKSLSENRLGEGDSPILLRGLRKIGTVTDGSRIGNKAQIIREDTRLGVDYALTRSCYDPDPSGIACDACLPRLNGYKEAGLVDPAPYRT